MEKDVREEYAEEEEGGWEVDGFHVFLDDGLGVEVKDAGVFAFCDLGGVGKTAPDYLLDIELFGNISDVLPLLYLPLFIQHFLPVCNREDSIRPIQCLLQGLLVVEIGFDEFDALGGKSDCGWFGGVAGDASELELRREGCRRGLF